MTPQEVKQAEDDAKQDAAKLGLVLLLLFRRHHGFEGHKVVFDESTAKFRIDGRAVAVTSIRMYLTRIEDRLGQRLLKITTDLENRQISFAQWKREFDRTVSSIHILTAALILGSITKAANHRAVQERIDEQLKFGDDFGNAVQQSIVPFRATALESGKDISTIPKVQFRGLSIAKIKARAKSYVRAGHVTFSNIELQVRIALGVDTEAKRVLRAAEHCHNSAATPGCLELAQKGFVPIEEMVPIGNATCRNWCRCYIVYR
jgi:hypothetical protein